MATQRERNARRFVIDEEQVRQLERLREQLQRETPIRIELRQVVESVLKTGLAQYDHA